MFLADISTDAETVYVAIAAAGGAVLASTITGVVAYRVMLRQLRGTTQLADGTRAHEVAMAREERDQRRRLDAYIAIMRHVGHWNRMAEKHRLDLTVRFDPPLQDPKPDEVDYSSEALGALVASPGVQALVIEFNRSVAAMIAALGSFRTADAMRVRADPGTVQAAATSLQQAKDACTAVLAAGTDLRDRMAAELASPQESG